MAPNRRGGRCCGFCPALRGSYASVPRDDHAWKWVALSLHSAVQGACVCHLVTTASPVGVLTKENTAEWLEFLEARGAADGKRPKTILADFRTLLKRVRRPNSGGDRSNTVGVQLNDGELNWLLKFHRDIRNEFTHFSSKGWSIEVSGLPDLTQLGIRLIRQMHEIGWAFRHQENEWHAQFLSALDNLEHVSREHQQSQGKYEYDNSG